MPSWRPEEKEWENPYVEILKEQGGHFESKPEILGVGLFIMPDPLPGITGSGLVEAELVKAKVFEAGADALLEALRERGYHADWFGFKNIWETQTKTESVRTKWAPLRGTLVFIPDDKSAQPTPDSAENSG